MTFTFEDAKLMYQSGIFKLITYRSLKRKLLKAKEIQAGLDNNAPQLYIKQYLIEQYINKLNIVQEKFRKTSSGISDQEELYVVQYDYIQQLLNNLKNDENFYATEAIINKVFDLSEDISIKLTCANIDLTNLLKEILVLEYGMLYLWHDYYDCKVSDNGSFSFYILDNKLYNWRRNFIAFTWENMSAMSDEFAVFNKISGTLNSSFVKYAISKLLGFSIDLDCIEENYKQNKFCTISFLEIKDLINNFTEIVSLVINLKINKQISLEELFSICTPTLKEYVLYLQKNQKKINDLPLFFKNNFLVSNFDISNTKHITRTIVNSFFSYKAGTIEGKYGQCIGMLFEQFAICWLKNNEELKKYGYQIIDSNKLFHFVDSDIYKTTKCDSDIVLVNENDGHVVFLQFKYRVQSSTPIYLEEEVAFSQKNELLNDGVIQLNNLKKELDINVDFKNKIEQYVIENSALNAIKHYDYILIHNLHNFDFLQNQGIAMYDWNTFKNLLTTFYYETNIKTNQINFNNHLSNTENIPISNITKMQEHILNYLLQIDEKSYTTLHSSWEAYMRKSFVYCEKIKFQF